MGFFSGCLEVNDGTILKHVQRPPYGQRELDFYDEIFQSTDDNTLIELRSFVPEFHGVIHVGNNGGVTKRKKVDLFYYLSQLFLV